MKTKDILKTVLFLAGIIMLTAACNKKDEDSTPTLDFEITIPDDWSYLVYANEGFVYYAASPQTDIHDSVTEDIVVMKYASDQLLDPFFADYMDFMEKDTSFHPITVVDTAINGEEAIKLTHFQTIIAINEYKHDTLIMNAKMQKYVMMFRQHGYVISFDALRTTFDEYHPIFDSIIATFHFKE